MDVDRVRAWPRLPRAELALLFPSGHTQHVPADGVPLTRDDVREARANHKELAMQVAQFFELRSRPKQPVMTASLSPSLPQLLSGPRPVDRHTSGTMASDEDRAGLAALAARDPAPRLLSPPMPASRKGRGGDATLQTAAYDPNEGRRPLYREGTVVPAPEYDDEHPEELSYRPFPIAPFLTATASADDPALSVMVHPNLGKILETMDQENVAPPMRLRPGVHAAELLWAQHFKGEAVDLSSLLDTEVPRGGPLPDRKVAIQRQ
jgi:hypothetical protein